MSSKTDREAALPDAARASAKVELPDAFQSEIRELARALPTLDYYALLRVEREAEPAEIRDAFFHRSKTFHPDRYFKKELGPYRELLTEVYKRIVAAHDVLRDSKLRAAYDRSLAPSGGEAQQSPVAAPAAPSKAKQAAPAAAKPAVAPAAGSRGPSLRSRLGLQSPGMMMVSLQKQLEQSRGRAQKHFDAALAQKASGDWARAAQLVELALAFDPREKRYHDELADILPRANADRAAEVRRKAEILLHGDRSGAADLLEEAAQLCPTDADLADKLATLFFDMGGEFDKAALYAERAVALEEENVRFRKNAARAYRKLNQPQKARKHLQRAWELDPLDKEIRLALQTL